MPVQTPCMLHEGSSGSSCRYPHPGKPGIYFLQPGHARPALVWHLHCAKPYNFNKM